MNIKCCFCGQPILGLPGCDAVLDTVFLDEYLDHELFSEKAYGQSHGTCLHSSQWFSTWQSRIATNLFKIRGLKDLSHGKGILGWNDPTAEFAVLNNGLLFWVSSEATKYSNGSVFATFSEEICWPIDDLNLANSIKNQLELTGEVDGSSVISSLSDNLSYSKLLNPILKPYEDDPAATMEGLSNSIFEGTICYELHILDSISKEISVHLNLI